MSHLLDANACIDHLRRGPASKVTVRLKAAPLGTIFLCSVVVGELLFGARQSREPVKALAEVRAFCAPYRSLPFDDPAAEEYALIRAHLAALGTPISPNDTKIAAIARHHGLTLVTHNTAELGRVPGLSLDDWQ